MAKPSQSDKSIQCGTSEVVSIESQTDGVYCEMPALSSEELEFVLEEGETLESVLSGLNFELFVYLLNVRTEY